MVKGIKYIWGNMGLDVIERSKKINREIGAKWGIGFYF